MTKKREEEQDKPADLRSRVEPAPSTAPALSRRELLIRTGQVALVVGSTNVVATLLTGCGDDGKRKCYPLSDDERFFLNDNGKYSYSQWCYETYRYDGELYGDYVLKSRVPLAGAPTYSRSE